MTLQISIHGRQTVGYIERLKQLTLTCETFSGVARVNQKMCRRNMNTVLITLSQGLGLAHHHTSRLLGRVDLRLRQLRTSYIRTELPAGVSQHPWQPGSTTGVSFSASFIHTHPFHSFFPFVFRLLCFTGNLNIIISRRSKSGIPHDQQLAASLQSLQSHRCT